MRVLEIAPESNRVRLGTPFRPRDKASTWRRRQEAKTYPGLMVKTGPDLNAFSRWVRRVLDKFKDERGWGITKVAQEGGISRNLLTNWRDANWYQGKPTRASVEKFCDNLRLNKEEPFAHLRLALDEDRRVPKDHVLIEAPDVDAIIRRIEIRLGQKPPAEERRELELRLVRARRARDAQRLADELMEEIRIDLDRSKGESA